MSITTPLAVIDDSGLLAIVDCAKYPPFLGEDWTYDGIIQHFKKEMEHKAIVVWDCGDGGGTYRISVRRALTRETGFRSVQASIIASSDLLHICSYTALTMAAQFNDYTLPAEEERNLSLIVDPGSYVLRLIQTYDPRTIRELVPPAPHFILEIERGQSAQFPNIPWLPV